MNFFDRLINWFVISTTTVGIVLFGTLAIMFWVGIIALIIWIISLFFKHNNIQHNNILI